MGAIPLGKPSLQSSFTGTDSTMENESNRDIDTSSFYIKSFSVGDLFKLGDSGTEVDVSFTTSSYENVELETAIEKSKYILDLENNWDEEDSFGYEEETLNRAYSFLRRHFEEANRDFSTNTLDIPNIYHGRDGGIDILWDKENLRLLTHVPKDENSEVTLYGEKGATKFETRIKHNVISKELLFFLTTS